MTTMGMQKVDPFAAGVLDRDVHERLVEEISTHAADAGIQPPHIWTPLAGKVSSAEYQWVKRFRYHTQEGHTGLCVTGGAAGLDMEGRFSALAGALVRNFIRARVTTLDGFIELCEASCASEHTCILIPNFSSALKAVGVPAWKIQILLDGLKERHLAGKQTVLYAPALQKVGTEYGAAFVNHIRNNFTLVNLD